MTHLGDEQHDRREPRRAWRDEAPMRLLVAEDVEVNRLVISAMLEPLAVEAVFAVDGHEALERLEEGGLLGALIDIRMPVMDGETCARLWREREALRGGPRLPLIACSADTMPDQIERQMAAGFDEHLAKPIDLGALAAAIDRLTDRARASSDAA